jgi:hypothetical protein
MRHCAISAAESAWSSVNSIAVSGGPSPLHAQPAQHVLQLSLQLCERSLPGRSPCSHPSSVSCVFSPRSY